MTTFVARLRWPLVAMACVAYLAIGGEALCRFLDGYSFTSLALTPRHVVAYARPNDLSYERRLVASATFNPEVSASWFFLSPSPLDEPVDQNIHAREIADPQSYGLTDYIWNDQYLEHPDANMVDVLRHLHRNDIYTFKSYDGDVYPRYRFPANVRSSLGTTNNFGWLSSNISFRKPPRTIRIGIIGDSTSHNTYGRYLQAFLTAWARAKGSDLNFEVLNSARQGFGFRDALATLRYELGPMGLDYAYIYFVPEFVYLTPQLTRASPGVEYGKPPHLFPSARHGLWRLLASAQDWSALSRHLLRARTEDLPDSVLREPDKPHLKVLVPGKTSDGLLTLGLARRIAPIARTLQELDEFKAQAIASGAEPIVSTDRLCVFDGMALANGTNRPLYEYANTLLWPLTYRATRRILDFLNHSIAAWALLENVPVVDIDGKVPRRPELCSDIFHDLELGQRLRAWVIFQTLLPIIERDVAAGIVPRPNGPQTDHHPYLDVPTYTIDRKQLIARYDREAARHARSASP